MRSHYRPLTSCLYNTSKTLHNLCVSPSFVINLLSFHCESISYSSAGLWGKSWESFSYRQSCSVLLTDRMTECCLDKQLLQLTDDDIICLITSSLKGCVHVLIGQSKKNHLIRFYTWETCKEGFIYKCYKYLAHFFLCLADYVRTHVGAYVFVCIYMNFRYIYSDSLKMKYHNNFHQIPRYRYCDNIVGLCFYKISTQWDFCWIIITKVGKSK